MIQNDSEVASICLMQKKKQMTHFIVNSCIHDPVPLVERCNVGQHSRCEEAHFLCFTYRFAEHNLDRDERQITSLAKIKSVHIL